MSDNGLARPENHVVVLFGATGDLSTRMVAVRAEVDNWRWHGVPFFLRSGKAMGAGRQVITIGFHEPPQANLPRGPEGRPDRRSNEIVIDFADPG